MKSLTIPSAAPDFDFYVLTGSIVYNPGIDASTALETGDVLDHLVLQPVVKEQKPRYRLGTSPRGCLPLGKNSSNKPD